MKSIQVRTYEFCVLNNCSVVFTFCGFTHVRCVSVWAANVGRPSSSDGGRFWPAGAAVSRELSSVAEIHGVSPGGHRDWPCTGCRWASPQNHLFQVGANELRAIPLKPMWFDLENFQPPLATYFNLVLIPPCNIFQFFSRYTYVMLRIVLHPLRGILILLYPLPTYFHISSGPSPHPPTPTF